MICSFVITTRGQLRKFCGKYLFPSSWRPDCCYICPEHGCRIPHEHREYRRNQ